MPIHVAHALMRAASTLVSTPGVSTFSNSAKTAGSAGGLAAGVLQPCAARPASTLVSTLGVISHWSRLCCSVGQALSPANPGEARQARRAKDHSPRREPCGIPGERSRAPVRGERLVSAPEVAHRIPCHVPSVFACLPVSTGSKSGYSAKGQGKSKQMGCGVVSHAKEFEGLPNGIGGT